jgi:ArsR family transcriptional regulator, lead/cadmium/zinc/bismuth-responsive transcriptional repressor
MKRLASQSSSCDEACLPEGRSGSANACCGPAACPPGCCEQVESIRARPLLGRADRRKLALLFKVLDNDTRLHILHVLIKSGELSVNDLADQLEMKPQAISNQLQKLAARQIVEPRRDGNLIFYRVVDPCVTMLLDLGLCLVNSNSSPRGAKRRPAARSNV